MQLIDKDFMTGQEAAYFHLLRYQLLEIVCDQLDKNGAVNKSFLCPLRFPDHTGEHRHLLVRLNLLVQFPCIVFLHGCPVLRPVENIVSLYVRQVPCVHVKRYAVHFAELMQYGNICGIFLNSFRVGADRPYTAVCIAEQIIFR